MCLCTCACVCCACCVRVCAPACVCICIWSIKTRCQPECTPLAGTPTHRGGDKHAVRHRGCPVARDAVDDDLEGEAGEWRWYMTHRTGSMGQGCCCGPLCAARSGRQPGGNARTAPAADLWRHALQPRWRKRPPSHTAAFVMFVTVAYRLALTSGDHEGSVTSCHIRQGPASCSSTVSTFCCGPIWALRYTNTTDYVSTGSMPRLVLPGEAGQDHLPVKLYNQRACYREGALDLSHTSHIPESPHQPLDRTRLSR